MVGSRSEGNRRDIDFLFTFPETTPGVFQASGYADLTTSQSMWCVFGYSMAQTFVDDSYAGGGSLKLGIIHQLLLFQSG